MNERTSQNGTFAYEPKIRSCGNSSKLGVVFTLILKFIVVPLEFSISDYIDVAFDKLRQREQSVAEVALRRDKQVVEAAILKWNDYNSTLSTHYSATTDLTRSRGCEVIDGFFLGAAGLHGQKYDIVIFNDSLEHIRGKQYNEGCVKGVEHKLVFFNHGYDIMYI